MKRLLLLVMVLFYSISINADEKDPKNRNEINAKVVDFKSSSAGARHAPAVIHILLFIEDSSITLCFNGDFGPGYYQLTDNTSGNAASGSVVAEAGSTECVPFPVSATTSFDFYIEFEDGSWSHLTWGN